MIVFHKINVDGKTHYRELYQDKYGEIRKEAPQEIKVKEINISTREVDEALGKVEKTSEGKVLWNYIIYLERLLGQKLKD